MADAQDPTPPIDPKTSSSVATLEMARAAADPADARLIELLDGDLSDDDLHAEALDLLRKHPALDDARAYVVARAHEAKAKLAEKIAARHDKMAVLIARSTA